MKVDGECYCDQSRHIGCLHKTPMQARDANVRAGRIVSIPIRNHQMQPANTLKYGHDTDGRKH
jgi:hypothetical protein